MFRKFAYQFSGPDNRSDWGTDWTPPWMNEARERVHHGMRHWQMSRMGGFRGPFGPRGGPFGGHHEGGGRGERFFGRGDMKFALLELLRERPMYGYEMIKALEERSGGFYTPSPGSIYPTLQMLEERGFVSSQETEGKKVYSITDSGRTMLTEHQQQEQFSGPPWMRHGRGPEGRRPPGPRPEMQALRTESMEVARLFAIAGRSAFTDPAQMARLRSVIANTRKELTELIYGDSAPTGEASPSESTTAE